MSDGPDTAQRGRTTLLEHQLAAIVECSDDAIIGKALDGTITSWNAAAERIFGYTAQEAIGRSISLIIPPDLQDEERQIIGKLARGERLDHFETERLRKDGSRIALSLTVSPIKDDAGKIVGSSKIARDITHRKQAEEERDRLLREEHAARKQAEEASRLKDEFLATVSHELRNPLSSIVGWAALLRSGKLNPEQGAQAVEAIARNAQAQSQLISDLLDVSRIIAGRLRLDIRSFGLAKVLEAAIDVVRPAAEAKSVRLQAMLDPAAQPMVGDPDRLQQVFWNLLSNAVKFTPKGGRVHVVLQRINSSVEVSVSDTGVGIRAELLPYVFDRFRQGDATASRDSGGLGLGLAIVRHLVELHGGTVRAESKGAGLGAIFTVRLPVMVAPTASHEEEQVHPSAGGTPLEATQTLDGLRILVVDDDADAREIISTILAQARAEVRRAASASEALKILDEWLPDALISDIGIPQQDGYALIRELRARPVEKGGRIPAAALTAYARPEDRMRVLAAGYQMHIPKPIQPAELVAVVASIARRI
jgi:PAS domain S-box-containing protein